MNVNEITAGREMDALIAEHVMGWRWIAFESKEGYPVRAVRVRRLADPLGWEAHRCDPARGDEPEANPPLYHVPEYSTSIGAAWQVVEKMIARGDILSLAQLDVGQGRYWEAHFRMAAGYGVADTAPLAICRAALRSVRPKPRA